MANEEYQIPIFLINGQLDSGKTRFISDTIAMGQFADAKNKLLIVCEEGEEEYSEKLLKDNGVDMVVVEKEDFNIKTLNELDKKYDPWIVIIEYNGMWLIDDLYQKLPVNWVVYQEMAFADARTFLTYNNNMRNLTVDKMKSPEVIIFKHFDRSMDKMDYHKIVRVITRRCQIIYEYAKDQIEFDDIEDPLPYDIEAPLVEIEDQNYAIWYTDINEEEDKSRVGVCLDTAHTLAAGYDIRTFTAWRRLGR